METFLFATDFSNYSNKAMSYAIQLANASNTRLVIFNSFAVNKMVSEKDFKKEVLKEKTLTQFNMEYEVTEVCRKNKMLVPDNIEYYAQQGVSTVENILAAAKKFKAQLIIVGTHGETGLKKVLFGSVTAELIEHATKPVLAIPQNFQFVQPEKIVYASDLKHIDKELKALSGISKNVNAPIELLFLDYWKESKKADELFYKSNVRKQIKNLSFVKKSVSLEKTMAEHLKNYSRKHKGAIIAMFPEKRNFFEQIFLKSITEKLASHLNRPLLSIRKNLL